MTGFYKESFHGEVQNVQRKVIQQFLLELVISWIGLKNIECNRLYGLQKDTLMFQCNGKLIFYLVHFYRGIIVRNLNQILINKHCNYDLF